MGITAWWRKRVLGSAATRLRIEPRSDGLAVEGTHADGRPGTLMVKWPMIAKIVAFKRDVYGADQLCVGIELLDERTAEVDESMEGWPRFVKDLPRYLPGALRFEDWFTKAAFPAFEVSPVIVFQRAAAEAQAGDEPIRSSGAENRG